MSWVYSIAGILKINEKKHLYISSETVKLDQNAKQTWTTLTTHRRENGREMTMRRRERKVRRRANKPGPSSQAAS